MQKTKIMVVEDERIVAKDIGAKLKRLGYRLIYLVFSGEEAVTRAAEINPDLILMDIVLRGGMDGIDAAYRIRSRSHIPVIYLTAYADNRTLERVKITEPFGYMVKPFHQRELCSLIEIALDKRETEKKLEEKSCLLYAVLEGMSNGIVVTDSDHLIKFINRHAETYTGWSKEEAQGKDVAEITKITPLALSKLLLGNHTVLVARDGIERPVYMRSSTLKDDQGKTQGIIWIIHRVDGYPVVFEKPSQPESDTGVEEQAIKFMVVSPYVLLGEAIEKKLRHEMDIEMIAHASNYSEMMPHLEQQKPDVLFLDTDMPHLCLGEIVESIRVKSPFTKILLFLHSMDQELILNSLSLGVKGFMTYESSNELLLQAARALSREQFWLDPKLISRSSSPLFPLVTFNQALKAKLTKKEKEIFQLVVQGLSNKQISDRLFISGNTVKNHLAKVFFKLNVSNRLELILCHNA